MEIEGKKILVTGASGFIGSRLCEVLYMHYRPVEIIALVRNMGRAARIGRMKINIIRGNILDARKVEGLAREADIIVHLAAGDRKTIVKGTRIVAKAARKHNVKRFVHMSSAAVYGLRPNPSHVREDAPLKYTGNPYSDAKIDAEKIIQKGINRGLNAVILRPRIIYGPYSVYVTQIFSSLRNNKFTLVNDGSGACNCVYIDNLIHAIILSTEQDDALGETFFVTDGERKTWGEFYKAFLEPLGSVEFINVSSQLLDVNQNKAQDSLLRSLKQFVTSDTMKAFLREAPLLGKATNAIFSYLYDLPEDKKIKIKDAIGMYRPERHLKRQNDLLDFDLARLIRESGTGFTDISKAERILGYEPIVKFEEGVKLTRQWLEFAKII